MVEDETQVSKETLDELERDVITTLKEGNVRATDEIENQIIDTINNVVEANNE